MKIQVNVKIEEKIVKKVHKVSKLRGDDFSDFVRISINKELARLGFLTSDEMKALGVSL